MTSTIDMSPETPVPSRDLPGPTMVPAIGAKTEPPVLTGVARRASDASRGGVRRG
jgi:hypothetical protein